MPKFNYVAMDSRGKETKGTLEVANQNEAISRLKEMGYFPTKVIEADKSKEKPDKKAKGATAAPNFNFTRLKFMGLNLDFSIEKAKRELGYSPRVDFDDAMNETMAWYR